MKARKSVFVQKSPEEFSNTDSSKRNVNYGPYFDLTETIKKFSTVKDCFTKDADNYIESYQVARTDDIKALVESHEANAQKEHKFKKNLSVAYEKAAKAASEVKDAIKALENDMKVEESKVNDMKEIKKQLNEAETKELKICTDKKRLGRVVKHADEVIPKFLLDGLSKFVTGDANATYATSGKAHFASPEALNRAMRDTEHMALSKADVEKIMKEITGDEAKTEEENGRIYTAITRVDNVKANVDFFPYFKMLSKACHMSMTLHKEKNLERKVVALKAAIKAKANEEHTQKAIMEAISLPEGTESSVRSMAHVTRAAREIDDMWAGKQQFEDVRNNQPEQADSSSSSD